MIQKFNIESLVQVIGHIIVQRTQDNEIEAYFHMTVVYALENIMRKTLYDYHISISIGGRRFAIYVLQTTTI